ncbi:MAG: hypothetical protein EOP43_07835 [Sphingobacteriaceae bacterium]|nr:MAG: hypothetical protein EOP43_07835 [Sphingobacteriaceae bacterium]
MAGLTFKNYAFASADSIIKPNKVPKRHLAITRVVFNPNHSKACYYVNYSIQKPYSANGEILFAEKKFERWSLIYRLPYFTLN